MIDGLFNLFYFNKKKRAKYFLYLFVGGFVLFKVKPYLLILAGIAFIPILVFGIVRKYKSVWFRFFASWSLYFFIGIISFLGVLMVGQVLKSYNPQQALQYLSLTQEVQLKTNQILGGSGYTLGVMEPTYQSLLKNSFAAINVTLFRPYAWEVQKIINIPTMIESLLTLLLTILVILKLGPFRFFYRSFSNPVILFCLLFSLLVGIFIGLVAFNFGTLVRYKIPILPFYYVALILLFYQVPKPSELYKS